MARRQLTNAQKKAAKERARKQKEFLDSQRRGASGSAPGATREFTHETPAQKKAREKREAQEAAWKKAQAEAKSKRALAKLKKMGAKVTPGTRTLRKVRKSRSGANIRTLPKRKKSR